MLVVPPLGAAGARRPLDVDGGIERRDAVDGGVVRVGAALEQHLREVEVAVDGGLDERRGVVADLRLVDVHARVEERLGGVDVPFARGKEKRRHAAVGVDELVAGEVAIDAGRLGRTGRRRVGAVVPPADVAVPAAALHRAGLLTRRFRRRRVAEEHALELAAVERRAGRAEWTWQRGPPPACRAR